MALIITLLVAFPLGFFLRNRTSAFIAYIALHGFVFTFQTANLILEWAGGSTAAFGATFPDVQDVEVWGYGIVNLVIFAAGFGLVVLGDRLARRRDADPGRLELDKA